MARKIIFKRTKCQCKGCPLDGQQKLYGYSEIDNARVLLISNAPSSLDLAEGAHFSGAVGAKLKEAVASSGLVLHTLHRTSLLLCKPLKGAVDTLENSMALKACLPGFLEEVAYLKKKGLRVLVPMSNEALRALGLEGKIGKVRGSVYEYDKMVAVPTYSPDFILRGMWKEEPTWIADFQKVREVSITTWTKPKESFNLFPTVADVQKFVKNALGKNLLIGVDIETTSLNPEYSKILMIGLASSPETVLVVPFTKKGGSSYWNLSEEKIVRAELRRLLATGRLAFQNAPFDTWHLERHGFPCPTVVEDTMLMHHAINPELPHNLGYIVSVYGKTPFWKDVVLGNADKMIQMDDEVVRTYNARDCAVLLQCIPEMYKHLKDNGTERVYREISLKLIGPLRRMSMNGLPLNLKAIEKKRKHFVSEATRLKAELMVLADLPFSFNLDSGDHMRLLLWNIMPPSAKKVAEEKKKIDESPRGRKDTKKYKELLAKTEVFEKTKPLYVVNISPPRTESGAASVDAEALVSIERAALRRLAAIEDIAKKKESHKQEIKDITKLRDFLALFREYSKYEKLATTFTGFPYGKDSRVHPSYKIHGTATGRLSSSEPNAQNFPSEVLEVFEAPKGRKIIKADYSNIELRVLAYLTGEETLIKAFESGQNIHDVNCKLLFGIDESSPIWKVARRAAKVFVFGRSYGGGVEGIYKQLVVAVPELGLALEHFKRMDKNYFDALPRYKAWVERMQKQARNTRCVETAFGRKRYLLGTPDQIERMALNTPIQGTAGEVALTAIIELDAVLMKKFRSAKLIGTVHDSILAEVDDKDVKSICKVFKQIMEKEYLIEGRGVRFPVDIEVGQSWGSTELVKL